MYLSLSGGASLSMSPRARSMGPSPLPTRRCLLMLWTARSTSGRHGLTSPLFRCLNLHHCVSSRRQSKVAASIGCLFLQICRVQFPIVFHATATIYTCQLNQSRLKSNQLMSRRSRSADGPGGKTQGCVSCRRGLEPPSRTNPRSGF
jgi:hypothetical protein